ncbi:HalOD1 output domain-containing protein [Halomicrococcus sp. NG-SE-24]|uniref:HalOD1 output domain-containing protein n=1 Tax=Halomicrococcus sp. NG-SE-24 TaxID=3436928 RepID=UPI003D967BC9
MAAITVGAQSERTSSSRASSVVLEALSQYAGIDVDGSDFRLYDVIDPDALDSLFSHQRDTNLSVEFDVRDATVTVWRNDSEVRVRISDDE